MSVEKALSNVTPEGAEGVGFLSCSVLDAAQAQGVPGGRRRQVVVNGRRVKTIDVHAHCYIQKALDLLGDRASKVAGEPWRPGIIGGIADRLRAMDEQGIDMQALSINPFWYAEERDVAAELIRVQNDALAELCAEHPDRFVAFATAALQYPDLAVQQLEHGVKKLGLRGVAVGSSVDGKEFADPKFHPFWAKAEELGVLIFIHPRMQDFGGRLQGNGWLTNVIANPLDTTIALSHLIFEGTLDRFPGLKICSAHGGGFLPSYAARFDHGCRIAPHGACDSSIVLKKKPTEYLRQMYYDSLIFTSEALRHLAAEVGASQVVIGTDHPIPWQTEAVDHILKTPGLSDDERIAMLGGTAAKLLGIKP